MILLEQITNTDGLSLTALVTSLGGGGSLLLKFIVDKTKMKGEIIQLKIDLDKSEKAWKEKAIELSSTKKAFKREIMTEMEKKDQVLHTRIDRVRDDNIKSYEKLETKIENLERKGEENTTKILEALQNR